MVVQPVTPVTPTPPHPIKLPISTQAWRDVVFLHWEYEPDALRHLVPAGTRLDVHEGRTWVGLVALRLHGVRLGGLLRLPYVGDFPEINLRLYTVGEDGWRSTVFLTMEAARLAVVLPARTTLRLPYHWSDLRYERHGPAVSYFTQRRWPGPSGAGVGLSVRMGEPVQASDTEHFFTARWGLHTPWYGKPLYLPFAHEQWPLHSAKLLDFADDGLFEAVGVPVPDRPADSVLYAPAVHPRSGPPIPVSGS
jgi:uncharacterized protein